ncbi:MAG: hypothetical protein K0U98_23875 [Deltaproteobacteria bacterium]|nr:hypothetical protein [Deltaproteobacteria bacterium]
MTGSYVDAGPSCQLFRTRSTAAARGAGSGCEAWRHEHNSPFGLKHVLASSRQASGHRRGPQRSRSFRNNRQLWLLLNLAHEDPLPKPRQLFPKMV